MDGYKSLAESYKKALEQQTSDSVKESMQRTIDALNTLSGKSEEQICELFQTGAFNDICKGYLRTALKNCDIPEKKQAEVMEELRWLFDTMDAGTAKKKA